MQTTDEQPLIYKEQFPIEIREELLKKSAKDAFAKGGSYVTLLQKFATSVYPQLIQRIEALEQCQSNHLLASIFLQAKREYFETKAWFEFNLRVLEEVKMHSYRQEAEGVVLLLARQLQRIEEHASKTYDLACQKFPADYAPQLAEIYQKIDQILIGGPQKLAAYTQEQKQIYFEKIKTSKEYLAQIASLIVEHRPTWFKDLMQDARGFYFSFAKNGPYSIIYTLNDTLYIPLEAPEHFLGRGEGKIVCRTIDFEKAEIHALIKPRLLFSFQEETEEELSKQQTMFDFAWRESNFLMKLQKKIGIIQVFERIVFQIHQKQHLFLIEEKYEDLNLLHYVMQLQSKPDRACLDLKTKMAIADKLLQGLASIHEANILHRDIKPQNILLDLSDPKNLNAVLCDFNLACYRDDQQQLKYAAFSVMGCPPEYAAAVLSQDEKRVAQVTTVKTDIWAMGMLFCFLFYDSAPPWLKIKELSSALEFIAKLAPDFLPKEYENRPFYSLIRKMLQHDPNQRPTAAEAYIEFQQVSAKDYTELQ
jgi:tRNA A-37 threonylcarbamoyl transferase component Bud32